MNWLDFLLDFISAALRTTTPIALAALACTVNESSGVINIGVEGSMIFTAFAAAVGAYYTASPWMGLLCGVVAGIFISCVLGVLAIYCNGQQIVVGIGINLLGPGLAYLVMESIWGNNGISPWLPGFKNISIPFISEIPMLNTLVSGYDITVYLSIVLVFIVQYMIFRTSFGLRLRATGENPQVVSTVGLNVHRLRMSAVILSGVLIGVSGTSLCLGAVNIFTNGIAGGRGFLAFAANQFGGWTPFGSYGASLLFGSMEALRIRLQSFGIPPQLVRMLPYLVTLLVLTRTGKKVRAPGANGIPYPHPISIPPPPSSSSKRPTN